MNTRMTKIFALFAFAIAFASSGAIAGETPAPAGANAGHAQDKAMMHEKMADLHKKQAECLKSGKPEKDCQAEMKAEMKKMHGDMKGMGHDCKEGNCEHDESCAMKDRHGKKKHSKSE